MNREQLVKIFKVAWRQILVVLILIILFFGMTNLSDRIRERDTLKGRLSTIETEVYALHVTEEVLNTQIALATSPAGVSEWARQQGIYVQPGDVPVRPQTSGKAAPTPTPTLVPTQRSVENWQIWRALFFGE